MEEYFGKVPAALNGTIPEEIFFSWKFHSSSVYFFIPSLLGILSTCQTRLFQWIKTKTWNYGAFLTLFLLYLLNFSFTETKSTLLSFKGKKNVNLGSEKFIDIAFTTLSTAKQKRWHQYWIFYHRIKTRKWKGPNQTSLLVNRALIGLKSNYSLKKYSLFINLLALALASTNLQTLSLPCSVSWLQNTKFTVNFYILCIFFYFLPKVHSSNPSSYSHHYRVWIW